MAEPEAYEVVLRRKLAEFLHSKDLGVYRPAGVYQPGERGIYVGRNSMPTSNGSDNAIVLRSLQSIASGRADMLYRIQIESRIKGSPIDAENLAARIARALDHRQNIPAGEHIAWVSLFSQLPISADAGDRCGAFQTFHFMGRRPPRDA